MDSYTATDFIKSLMAVPTKEEDLDIRICCNGGEPTAMWAMLSKLSEMPNKKKAKVDGKAYSGGAFALCYMDDVEAIDTSEFLFHRAAYSSYFESNPEYFDDATRGNLERVNASLRKAMEAKLDIPQFEKIAKCSMDELFSTKDRKDVFLTAKQAKQIGLVNRVTQITPKRKNEIETTMANVASIRSGFKMAAIHTPIENQNNNMEIKTLADLKANYPAIYAEAKQKGAAAELSRVNSFNVFRAVDPKAVDEAIKTGKPFTTDFQSEMLLKAASGKALTELEKEAAKPVNTPEAANVAETPEAKAKREQLEGFEKSVDSVRATREGKSPKA